MHNEVISPRKFSITLLIVTTWKLFTRVSGLCSRVAWFCFSGRTARFYLRKILRTVWWEFIRIFILSTQNGLADICLCEVNWAERWMYRNLFTKGKIWIGNRVLKVSKSYEIVFQQWLIKDKAIMICE